MKIKVIAKVEDILPWLQRERGKGNEFSSEELAKHIEKELFEVLLLIEPQGEYREVGLDYEPLKVNNWEIQSTSLEKFFRKKPKTGILFAATIGDAVDKEVKKMIEKGDMLKSYLWDGISSYLAEETVSILNKTTEYTYRQKGKKLSWRFSPGYGDWSLVDQPKILSLFPELNISVNSGGLMSPKKSVTALCGVEEN